MSNIVANWPSIEALSVGHLVLPVEHMVKCYTISSQVIYKPNINRTPRSILRSWSFWKIECFIQLNGSIEWVHFGKHKRLNYMAGFKRLRFPTMANRSAAGIPLAYINNFIQIWCGTPFYGMPCESDSHQPYLELHGSLFESSGRKYIWIKLLCSNTNDSRSGFHRADYNLWQCPTPVCHMIWIYIHSVPDGGLQAPPWKTTIVWNQLITLKFS